SSATIAPAAAAVQVESENVNYLNTLGVAQFRTGEYARAVQTLTQSEKRNATKEESQPLHLAFLAMAQHQLRKQDEAKEAHGRLREVMKQSGWAKDAESQGFLREAEELIEGKAAETK